MEYCPHCMRPASGERCPHCGGEMNWTAQPGQLPLGSLLRGSTGRVYQVGAAKGQGGFGITYAAMDLQNWERLAIKEYFPSRFASRDMLSMVIPTTGQLDPFQDGMRSFLEEGRMLSSVGALPSVVSVRDSFEANGTAYIVMEYVDGVPLHEVVKQHGRISWQELSEMLPALLRDLDILHRAGVIHRDISPDNLILTPEHTLKLLDFGSARSVQTGNMTVMMKPGFSPVEQYQSSGQGPCTDVYALAATIYFCLTGQIPPTAIDRLGGVELAKPNSLGAGLTETQEQALLRGMALQPASRPQSMREFSDALMAEEPEKPHKENPFTTLTGKIEEAASALGRHGEQEQSRSAGTETFSEAKPDHGKKRKLLAACGAGAAALLVLVLTLVFTLGGAKTTSQGLRYKTKGETARITGYKGTDITLNIPEKIDGKIVTCIKSKAFSGCETLREVTVPENVDTIEENAFRNCPKLEKITFAATGPSVSVHMDAFTGCDSLRCLVVGSTGKTVRFNGDLPKLAKCTLGQELTQGTVRDVQISGGVAYAITDLDRAVALTSGGTLPAFLGQYRVFDTSGNRTGVESGVTEDLVEYELNGDEAYIVGYRGEKEILVLPDDIDGVPITVICGGALDGETTVQSVLMPTKLTDIQSGAFRGCTDLRDISLYSSGVRASADSFRDCPRLRCVMCRPGDESAVADWGLEQDVRVYADIMETGVGQLDYVFVLDDGAIYAITTDDEAVLMDVPGNVTTLDVPEKVYGNPVVWTYERALDNVSPDTVINMAPKMGFPFELYDRADWDFEDADFSCGWLLSCMVCQNINESRTVGPKIEPDRLAVQAAYARAKELNSSYTLARPSGSKWTTALNDYDVDWNTATHMIRKFSGASDSSISTGLADLVDEMVEKFIGTDDEGNYYVRFAMALYYGSSSKTFYCGAFGILEN